MLLSDKRPEALGAVPSSCDAAGSGATDDILQQQQQGWRQQLYKQRQRQLDGGHKGQIFQQLDRHHQRQQQWWQC